MVTENRLIPDGEKVTLEGLNPGTIFAFGDDCIAVKSEYRCANGLIEAFIIDSGEQFWGGAKTVKEQNALVVQPLAIVEVVHSQWDTVFYERNGTLASYSHICPVCKYFYRDTRFNGHKYCPNCGAKMDLEA